MIIPNLMVRDLGRSVAFYRDGLGMDLVFALGPDRQMPEAPEGGVFATLEWEGAQLMLQTVESLAQELPVFAPGQAPMPGGTVYLRGMEPEPVLARLPAEAVIRPPFRQWYGMREAYLRDPDGHVICMGVPDGAPPD